MTGFFSIWYKVFEDESEVMQQLTNNTVIPGTATNCFNPLNNYNPIPRNSANLVDPI